MLEQNFHATPTALQYAPIFQEAFPIGTMFLAFLAISLGVLALYPSFRRYSVLLVLVGFFEVAFSLSNVFIEGFFMGLITAFCGVFFPSLCALKPRLRSNRARALLLMSGCGELTLGFLTPLIFTLILVPVGCFSLIVGAVSFRRIKPKIEPTVHKNHKKPVLAIVVAAIIFSASFLYYYDLTTRPAYVDISVSPNGKVFLLGENNSVTISCNNWGTRDANLNLVLSFQNAFLSSQTEQPYSLVDNETGKFPFFLKPGSSGSKVVFFTVDANVQTISCHLSMESAGISPLAGAAPINSLVFNWNATAQRYELSSASGYVV